MFYPTFGLAFEGLMWAMLNGLAYGLALLVLLWVAGALAAWAVRVLKRTADTRTDVEAHLTERPMSGTRPAGQ